MCSPLWATATRVATSWRSSARDVTQLYTRSSLIAAGAYADDYHTVDDVRRRLNRLAITNITTSGHDGAPLRTLRDNIVRAYHKRGDVQTTLLWVVDGEKLGECLEVFPDLKRTLGRSISLLSASCRKMCGTASPTASC